MGPDVLECRADYSTWLQTPGTRCVVLVVFREVPDTFYVVV